MSFKYFRHEDLSQQLYIKLTKFTDPKLLLEIYDEPSSSIATFVVSLTLTSGKRIIYKSSLNLVTIPNDSVLCCFTTPLCIQDLEIDTTIMIEIFSTTTSFDIPVSKTSFQLFGDFSSKFNKSPSSNRSFLLRQGRYKLVLGFENGLLEVPYYEEIFNLTTNIEKYDNQEYEKIE